MAFHGNRNYRIVFRASLSANAALTWTPRLELSLHDVVGAGSTLQNDQASGSPGVLLNFAQQLLKLRAGVNFTDVDGRRWGTAPSPDYSGTIPNTPVFRAFGNGANQIGDGGEYAMAKNDGQQAGCVPLYLGGQAATLPLSSWSLWAAVEGNGNVDQRGSA